MGEYLPRKCKVLGSVLSARKAGEQSLSQTHTVSLSCNLKPCLFKNNNYHLFYVHWYFASVYICVEVSDLGVSDNRELSFGC